MEVKTFSDTTFDAWYLPHNKEYQTLSFEKRKEIDKGKDTNLIIQSAQDAFFNDDFENSNSLFLTAIVRSRSKSSNHHLAYTYQHLSEVGYALSSKYPFPNARKNAYDHLAKAFSQFQKFEVTLGDVVVKDVTLIQKLGSAFFSLTKGHPEIFKDFRKKFSYITKATNNYSKSIHNLYSCLNQILEKVNPVEEKSNLSDTISGLVEGAKEKLEELLTIKIPKEIM